jgi:hypothetical protein
VSGEPAEEPCELRATPAVRRALSQSPPEAVAAAAPPRRLPNVNSRVFRLLTLDSVPVRKTGESGTPHAASTLDSAGA